MSKFNLSNYESYYIDYLEGNLSETDRVAFELFLNEHPKIAMEGELPDFTLTVDEHLSSDFISQLRVFNEHEAINASTIEGFLIASSEGILSNEKQKELQAFLLKNPSHLDTLGVYHQTKLKPDLNIAYPNKQGLRKGNDRRLIFGVISAVAAVFIGFVLLFSKVEERLVLGPKLSLQKDQELNVQDTIHTTDLKFPKAYYSNQLISCSFDKPVLQVISEDSIVKNHVDFSIENPSEILLSITMSDTCVWKKTNSEYVAFSEMESPIEPVFRFAFKKLRDKIDIRYAKATETKQGGFYLKLWNFELSRKVAPTGDLAVN
jgi:hypothetical protein